MKFFFLISSSTVRTKIPKKIKTVVGGQERVDVLSRILMNIYRWNNRVKTELYLIFYLSHPEEKLSITIPINRIEQDIRSELEATTYLINILNSPQEHDNIMVEKQDFSELLNSLSSTCNLCYLTSTGKDVSESGDDLFSSHNLCFILGSQLDLTEDQERTLLQLNPISVSIGQKEYLASHVVSIILHSLFINLK